MPDYALMNQCLYEGKAKEVEQMTVDALAEGRPVPEILNDGLIAGMSVEANIITREKPGALLVPADAVQEGMVFVIDGSRLRRRPVTLGIRGARAVEVASGLKDGERVASPAPTGAADGQHVRVVAPAL